MALTSFLNVVFERWTDDPGNTPMLLKAHRRAKPIYDHTLILILIYNNTISLTYFFVLVTTQARDAHSCQATKHAPSRHLYI